MSVRTHRPFPAVGMPVGPLSFGTSKSKNQVPGTPEPKVNMRNMDAQTDPYLENLTVKTTEFDAEAQTDFLLERPQTPLFMPAKIGVEKETQILEGELFDFDIEVEPVLEVLVARTLEFAVGEVIEEDELAAIRERQAHFAELRAAELLEAQRLEAAEKRRAEEKERRKNQEQARKELEQHLSHKTVSRHLSRSYLGSLCSSSLRELEQKKYFRDPQEFSVETAVLPSIIDGALIELFKLEESKEKVSSEIQQISETSGKERKRNHEDFSCQKEKFFERLSLRLSLAPQLQQRMSEERQESARLTSLENQRIEDEKALLKSYDSYRDPEPEPEPAPEGEEGGEAPQGGEEGA